MMSSQKTGAAYGTLLCFPVSTPPSLHSQLEKLRLMHSDLPEGTGCLDMAGITVFNAPYSIFLTITISDLVNISWALIYVSLHVGSHFMEMVVLGWTQAC